MIPDLALVERMADLLATDTTTLDAVADVEVILFINNVTLGPDTVIGDLTPATFDGYAAKAKDAAAPSTYTDPATGDIIISIPAPAGGWLWQTTGTTNLPQTVFGFALTDSTGADYYGGELLSEPVTLDAAGQGVQLPNGVTFRIPASLIS